MSFIEFEHRLTANIIVDYIMHNIKEYKIEKYIFSITLDNASSNNGAVKILKMQLNPMFFKNLLMQTEM